MTWSLSASGHAEDAEAEVKVVNAMRIAVRKSGATSARVYTQHHGQVDLLATEENKTEE